MHSGDLVGEGFDEDFQMSTPPTQLLDCEAVWTSMTDDAPEDAAVAASLRIRGRESRRSSFAGI